MSLGIQYISAAYDRISPFIHKTPLIRSKEIDKLCGCEIIFKADNFQKVGAFKARGACNAIMSMEEERLRCGVITHSSGNHGAALAWAATMKKTDCIVVMPKNASAVKVDAVNCYGESTEKGVDIFDRESVFIEKTLKPLVEKFPELKISLEHITTLDSIEYIMNQSDTVYGSITPQHYENQLDESEGKDFVAADLSIENTDCWAGDN